MSNDSEAAQILQEIMESAKKNATREVREIKVHEPGQRVRQGDVYVTCVPKDHPRGRRLDNLTLAPGVSSNSNHVAGGNVEVYEGTMLPPDLKVLSGVPTSAYLGPCFKVQKGGGSVEHHTHAFDKLPEGDYQVTYQVDARTFRRVVD